jgi:serine/threonine protein kinase
VFAAATVLVNLIKIPNGSGPPYFKYPHTREVRIFISRIRPAFLMYEDILRRCLSFDPKQRPTASELLTWFETQLKTSLSNS